MLALGHNVFYAGPRFSKDQPPRWPVYAVWRDGRWGPRRRLAWDDPRGGSIDSNGCGQRLVLPDGDILLALRFSAMPDEPKAVATAVCRFDGDELTIRRVGEELRHDAGRGLLEPSLVRFGDRILITLRAENRRGYVAASTDGLAWGPKQAWAWDDGEPLAGNGVSDPDRVAIMGNFHVTHAAADESWVTVGEWQPKNGIHGGLLMARIRWTRPNGLAPGKARTD